MVASRSARERKAGVQAGPLARVVIDLDGQGQFLYKISCVECRAPSRPAQSQRSQSGPRAWSAYRPGDDNGFMAAMDRWIFHLHEQHAGAQAPCLAYLGEAQQRLHDRREER